MQKIVAVLNDFDKIDPVLDRAVAMASEQKAVLEVLFVLEMPLFTVPDFFLPEENKKRDQIDKTKIHDTIREKVEALGYKDACAIFVFIDDTADRVAAYTEDRSGTLIISYYHEKISEEMLKKSHPSVLILKNDRLENRNISMPVELDKSAKACIGLTRTLFADSTIRVMYDNHYLTDREQTEEQKEAFERFKTEMGLEGDYIEEFAWNEADYGEDFEVMEEHLSALIEKNRSDLTVIYARSGDLIYGDAVSFALMRRCSTDFFFCKSLR